MTFAVEVILANPEAPIKKSVEVDSTTTVQEAAIQSALIDSDALAQVVPSRYGKLCQWEDTLNRDDRIELTFSVRQEATERRFNKVKSQKGR
ncbi:MAG: hypothetical protein CMF48_04420 [Legionellales bacterium]|nr:hypothetical protein [Legionellales bacterium]|tara:strand:- start:388 stop:663 length:276 start_codon:yes stop_codon:yes gene_type:complete